MNKSQSKSRAAQRHTARSSDEDRSRPPWLVVAFRIGTDNQGRRKIYRTVTGAWSVGAARSLVEMRAHVYQCVALVGLNDEVVTGDRALIGEWVATRRGLNRGQDWREAGRYVERETAMLLHQEAKLAREELEA